MTAPKLHVVALNEGFEISTTFLSRESDADSPDLSALAEALNLPGVDTAQLELFAVEDLGDMRLSDYITEAFAPKDPIGADTRARINAVGGHVVLLLDRAIPEGAALRSGPRARLIASLPLLEADHSADLPKADLTGRASVPDREDAPQEAALAHFTADRKTYWRDHAWLAAIAMALGMAARWIVGNPHVWTGAIGGLFAVAVRAFYLASDEATAQWVLTDTALKGPDNRHVRLNEIARLRTLGSAVQIITRAGDKHLIKYMAARPAVVARIERAAGRTLS